MQLMFHRVWREYNKPLKLENNTNFDLSVLEQKLATGEMEIFQKINFSLPFDVNIMLNSWNLSLDCNFSSLFTVCWMSLRWIMMTYFKK